MGMKHVGLTEETHPSKFSQGDAYTNPTLLDLIFALVFFSRFLKKAQNL